MFVKRIVESSERLSLINDALSKLYQAGYFEASLELSTDRAGPMGGSTPLESAALQRAFIFGYREAMQDLVHFKERYVAKPDNKPRPDFGAAAELSKTNTIKESVND